MSAVPKPSRVPATATPDGGGVVIGDGPVPVDVYIDFQCPFCRRFELSAGTALAAMVVEHQISIAYHPMNFLDQASTTHYSTRAAASSGCAADQDRFVDYAHALFVDQPPEGSAGLTDEQLIAIGESVGLGPAFASCVPGRPYLDWPPYVTARALAAGVEATPTVLVAGVAVPAESEAIANAVEQVSTQT
ncbi:MAG: thioredoxin domain-containing protein [Streptosporangiaceae bacterium]